MYVCLCCCNAKPAEGALTRILTVLHSLCFSSHFLFGTFISMLAFWDHAKYCQYYCLTERLSCIQFAFLCMILPVYLTTIILDLPFCCDCLTNLMFVFGPFACLLVSVYWINPVLVDGSDCYTGIDPLPEFTFPPVESLLNKLLLMDSNSASAASLQNTSPPMNPAEVSNLQAAFAYQNELLKGYQEQLFSLQSINGRCLRQHRRR